MPYMELKEARRRRRRRESQKFAYGFARFARAFLFFFPLFLYISQLFSWSWTRSIVNAPDEWDATRAKVK